MDGWMAERRDSRAASNMVSAAVWLSVVIAALALVAASAGLFWSAGQGPATITTVHNEIVELEATGLYRADSLLRAGANKGADLVTLALAVSLLLVAVQLVRRGSLRGRLLLTGTLVWSLYLYASWALGTAYNDLFLLYVGLFSASLIAFILAFASVSPQALASRLSPAAPRRGLAIFMVLSGVVTLGVWLMAPVSALIEREPPAIVEHGTTLVTHALDIAIIVPAAIGAGVLIWHGSVLGYRIAVSLLVLEVLLAPMITLHTVFQLSAGVAFTTAEIVGPIGGFLCIAVPAGWFLVRVLRSVEDGRSAEHGIGPRQPIAVSAASASD